MLAYFDTSAIIPLLIDEPATARCTDTWTNSDIVVSSAITFVEVHASLAAAARHNRLNADERNRAIDAFGGIWNGIVRVSGDDVVIEQAAVLSTQHALRGHDAVHCATALAAASPDFVAVTGDRDLLRVWSELGLATVDTAS